MLSLFPRKYTVFGVYLFLVEYQNSMQHKHVGSKVQQRTKMHTSSKSLTCIGTFTTLRKASRRPSLESTAFCRDLVHRSMLDSFEKITCQRYEHDQLRIKRMSYDMSNEVTDDISQIILHD